MVSPTRKRQIPTPGPAELGVVGYIQVSTDDQVESGAGLEAQREAIVTECGRRGWRLLTVFEDAGASGKSLAGRVGLREALQEAETGRARAIVVAKLDRLSRSLLDFASLMQRSRHRGWALVALDLGVDTTTPSGEMMANVLAVFAQFERRLIGQRTREALAMKRAAGVRLGRPPVLAIDTERKVRHLRANGGSLVAIAAQLNASGVATAHGGRAWHASTVRALLSRPASAAD